MENGWVAPRTGDVAAEFAEETSGGLSDELTFIVARPFLSFGTIRRSSGLDVVNMPPRPPSAVLSMASSVGAIKMGAKAAGRRGRAMGITGAATGLPARARRTPAPVHVWNAVAELAARARAANILAWGDLQRVGCDEAMWKVSRRKKRGAHSRRHRRGGFVAR